VRCAVAAEAPMVPGMMRKPLTFLIALAAAFAACSPSFGQVGQAPSPGRPRSHVGARTRFGLVEKSAPSGGSPQALQSRDVPLVFFANIQFALLQILHSLP